jgi:hypothetical protein
MSKRPRRNHSPAKVALATVKRDKTFAEMTQLFEVHSTLINQRRANLPESALDVLGDFFTPKRPPPRHEIVSAQPRIDRGRRWFVRQCLDIQPTSADWPLGSQRR